MYRSCDRSSLLCNYRSPTLGHRSTAWYSDNARCSSLPICLPRTLQVATTVSKHKYVVACNMWASIQQEQRQDNKLAVTKTITEVSRYQSTHKSYTSLSLPLVNFSTCYSSVHQMCSNSDSISQPNIFFILRQSTCSLNFKLKITIAHTVRQSHLYARSSQRGPVLPAGQTQTPVSASQGTSLIH